MPGVESLRANQYYANPRNVFWRIMGVVLGFSENASYNEKIASLKANRIALWDVMHTCERPGSLDANIVRHTIEPNDFVSLFQENSHIAQILFNGVTAEKEYIRRVLPNLSGEARDFKLLRLPSTSSAMARMSLQEKLILWSNAIKGA